MLAFSETAGGVPEIDFLVNRSVAVIIEVVAEFGGGRSSGTGVNLHAALTLKLAGCLAFTDTAFGGI